MKYQFEEFNEVGRRASKTPLVTITKHGMLNLNRSFMETFVRGKPFVIFHYDKTNNVIGLQLSDEERSNTYKIRSYRDDSLVSITALAFLKFHDIHHDKSRSYEAKLSEEGDLIIVDLNKK